MASRSVVRIVIAGPLLISHSKIFSVLPSVRWQRDKIGQRNVVDCREPLGTLRPLAEFNSSPAAVLNGLNRRLVGRLQGGFATTVVFRLAPSGDCTLANAGHLPPFLNSSEMSLEPSLPLGIDPNSDYIDRNILLHDEDRLTLYTDGVLEATNAERELYGFERVTALLADRPDAATIAATARTFGQEDDITVLTITRLPVVQVEEATSFGLATN